MKGENNRKFYDEAFMEVFTNQKIVKSLLKDFIKEEWVDLIDFSTMESDKSVLSEVYARCIRRACYGGIIIVRP